METRQRVTVGLLFSAGAAAAVAYVALTGERPARPAAGGERNGTGTVLGGTPESPAAPGDAVFAISGRVSGLVPGGASTLAVTVTNPNEFPIQLLTLDTRVAAPGPACPATSLTVERYAHDGGPAVSAPGGGTVEVPLRVELADSATSDRSACAGATFPLTFTGTAVAAR